MKKTLIILALFLGIASLAEANPNAATAPASAQEKYKKMDTNSDAEVTLEEFKALYPTMKSNVFDIIDSNNDNVISIKEWMAFQQQHMNDMKNENSKKSMGSPAGDSEGRSVDQGMPPAVTRPGGTMLIMPPASK